MNERILFVKDFFPTAAWAKSEEALLKFFSEKKESVQQCVNPTCFSVRAFSLEDCDDFCSAKCRLSFLGDADTLGAEHEESKCLD